MLNYCSVIPVHNLYYFYHFNCAHSACLAYSEKLTLYNMQNLASDFFPLYVVMCD